MAVIGSGPAGLACADQLNHVGHHVTVYERADRIGGLLMYGIPNMKLDKQIVQRRIDLMAAEGVEFVINTEVGRDVSGPELRQRYHAVVLCCGAAKPRDLPIEGRRLGGVHFAMEFLHGNTKHLLDKAPGRPPISAAGLDVIVIGGGDTGADCVGTSLRHGCKSITQFEILPQPPLERQPDNPWPEWPKVLRVDYGQEEAIARFGADPRNYLITARRFLGDEQGHVAAVETIAIEWVVNDSGRPLPARDSRHRASLARPACLAGDGLSGPRRRSVGANGCGTRPPLEC